MTKIGLGLAALGRPEYINIRKEKNTDKSETAFKKNALSMLDNAYSMGIRYFDTAPSYGKGEAFLQEWQKTRNHKDLTLATKWGYTYVANWQLNHKGAHEVKEHSIDKLIEQWEVSKALLPNLKVYQIHSATFDSGVLENQKVLKKLYQIKQETGLLIGLTSSGPNQANILREASEIKIQGKSLFDTFQVTYNIYAQNTYEILSDLIRKGKKVIIKEAVANGRIFVNPPVFLDELSQKYNVGIDAIAIRFIIDTLQPAIILSGASEKDQLTDNLKALDFTLTTDEIKILKNLALEPKKYWTERKALSWN